MKTILLVAALTLPVQQQLPDAAPPSTDVAEVPQGMSAHCRAAEGCVVLTRTALMRLLSEMATESVKACEKSKELKEKWL